MLSGIEIAVFMIYTNFRVWLFLNLKESITWVILGMEFRRSSGDIHTCIIYTVPGTPQKLVNLLSCKSYLYLTPFTRFFLPETPG